MGKRPAEEEIDQIVKVSARLPIGLHKRAKLEAVKRDLSIDGLIRVALEAALAGTPKVVSS